MLVTLTHLSGTLTHMYDTQDTYDTTMNYRYTPIIPTNHIHDRNGMIHCSTRMNHPLILYVPVLHTRPKSDNKQYAKHLKVAPGVQ